MRLCSDLEVREGEVWVWLGGGRRSIGREDRGDRGVDECSMCLSACGIPKSVAWHGKSKCLKEVEVLGGYFDKASGWSRGYGICFQRGHCTNSMSQKAMDHESLNL